MTYALSSGGVLVPYGFSRNHLGKVAVPAQVTAELPTVTWAPSNESEAGDWAVEQAKLWAEPEMKRRIGTAKDAISKELSFDPERPMEPYSPSEWLPPMTGDQSTAWTMDYVMRNGFPKNPDDAIKMTRAFLDSQGQQIGIHPAFVAATDLIVDFPDTPEEALKWTADVGSSFAQAYGIPLTTQFDTKSLVLTSTNAAMTNAGIPGAGAFMVTIDSLWDGTLTGSEAQAMIGTIGGVVAGAIGQAFGIPAPIGAFVGTLVTNLIMSWVGPLLGLGPSRAELRAAAMKAADRMRAAMMEQCQQMAGAAWTDYQRYFYRSERQIQQAIDEQSAWLQSAGGLRHFGNVYIENVESSDKTCLLARGSAEALLEMFGFGETVDLGDRCLVPLPRVIDKRCDLEAGCQYFALGGVTAWRRFDPADQEGVRRHDLMPDVRVEAVDAGAMIGGRVDASAALSFYGVTEYVTPYHALLASFGEPGVVDQMGIEKDQWGYQTPTWGATMRPDYEYLNALSYIRRANRPEDLSQCAAVDWANSLMGSLVQMGPATALVMRDIAGTVAAATAEYRLVQQTQQQGLQRMAAVAAAERRDLIRLRRELQRRDWVANGSLLAGGTGAMLAWAIHSMRKP